MEEKLNLLLVDDHQIVLDGLIAMLEHEEHYNISQALDGKHALDKVAANPNKYHLVITDITMPILNGIELCRAIKTHFDNIKVVILSMHNTVAYIKDAISAEADGYILKNIGQQEFISAIERIRGNGTYFSQEILPLMIHAEKKENQLKPNLTQRELEILKLIVMELTSKEIAEKLFISKQTVDTHRINLMQKTQSKTLVGLIKFAIQADLV